MENQEIKRAAAQTDDRGNDSALYRLAAESSLAGVYIFQGDRFLYLNPRMAQIFGYPDPETMKNRVAPLELVHPDDLALAQENLRRLQAGKVDSLDLTIRGRRRDGAVIYCELLGNRGEYRGKPAVIGTLLDITAQEKAREVQKERESRYCLVTEGSLAGVYLIQDDKFRYVNPILAQTFGYRPEEIIDRLGPLDLVHPEDREMIAANIRRRLSGEEEAAQYSFRGQRRDGSTVYCEILSRSTEYQGRPAVMGTLIDKSEKVQAERARQASEERYRTIVEDQTELVCRHLPDTTVTFVNEALCRYFGKSRQELLGQSYLVSIPEEDRDQLLKALRGLTPDNPIVILEQRVFNSQGEIRWQQWTNRGIFDAQGRLIEHQAVGLDITERMLAEEALKASEANYQTIFNAVNDGIAVVDLETGNFLEVNQRWCEMSGFSPEEARGLNVAVLCMPDSPYSPADAMRWISEASKEKPQYFEFMAQTKEGRRHWVEINLKRAFIGSQERLLAVIRDISPRKEAEEALRISEENYRTIFNSASDGLAVVEIDTGRFLDANQAALELNGYSLEEIRNSNFALFCLEEPPYTPEAAWNWHRKAIEEGPQTFEWKARDKGGRVQWVDINLKRTVIGGKECILANVRDITGRKRAEKALRDSEAKYRNLVEQIPAITYIAALDDVTSQFYISPQIEAILGFTQEEWLADPELFKKQIHPEDRDRVLTELLLSYARGGPFTAEYRMLSKAGRVVWLRDESRAIYDAEGQPLFMQGVTVEITKRRRAEEALREANNKLQTLVQASPLAIVGLDLSGKVVSWNPAAERIFGWRRDEVLGRVPPHIPEEKSQEYKDLWQRVLQGQSILGLELRRRKKDGAWIDVSLSTAPLFDAAGRLSGFMGVLEDITARKRTEAALRESEARFRAMFEGAPIGIHLTDLKTMTATINPALREMGGYSEAELLRFTGEEVTHPDDWQANNDLFAGLLTGKRSRFQKETRYRHKQGRWLWVRLSVSLLRDAAGEPLFVITMVEDITERKQAQEVAEEIRRQQEAILSNIPDIAWLKDRENRYIVMNEQFCRASGRGPRDLVGKTDADIWPADLAARYRTDDLEVIRTGKRKLLEEPVVNNEGKTFWVETIKTPIFNDRREVVGTAGIARDITARRRMEEALRKVTRALKAVTECHQALLRATNETELLSEVCRIIVEVGGYRMAWVGFGRQDEEKTVQPMAHKGFEEGYMDTVKVSWADVERGRGPVGTAIRTGKPAIIRDTRTDPRFAPWRQEALKRSYASVLSLPLGGAQPFGALAIYATEANAFDDEEINLLLALANDLAYGLKALRTGAERRRAQEALQESEAKYRSLMDGASDGIVLADLGGKINEVNQMAEEMLGYSEEELLGMNYTEIHPPELLDHVLENYGEILKTGVGQLHECLVQRRDGQKVPVDITHTMVEYGGQRVVQAVFRDITERQRAEEALRDSEQKLRLLASQLLAVQEKERRRLSLELHDELGQALTVLKIHLVAMENKLHRDQGGLRASCEYLQTYIDTVIENVRRLSRDLSPSILEDLGLSSSLKYLVQETCRNNNMFHMVMMDEIDDLFSAEAKINIYRIFQESLTNIVRHAEAGRINVEIVKHEDRVTFILKDNGKGFDLKKVRSRKLDKRGLGLTTMNERALMAGGTLHIRSRKGEGTVITLTMPIQR